DTALAERGAVGDSADGALGDRNGDTAVRADTECGGGVLEGGRTHLDPEFDERGVAGHAEGIVQRGRGAGTACVAVVVLQSGVGARQGDVRRRGELVLW